jgi:dTMP kinase
MNTKRKGLFITFEGGEGTGKTTQARILAARLQGFSHDVLLTREPGGTPQGEALRSLLVNGETAQWSANAEALLNYAARDAHMQNIIAPALAQGQIVICDRFLDSTFAYQQVAGGADTKLIEALKRTIVGKTMPHVTLIFDIDPAVGLARAATRGKAHEDRFERKGLAFHKKLRTAFRSLLTSEPKRCKRIDAAGAVEHVSAQVWKRVEGLIDG